MQRLAANAIMNMAYDCAESRIAIADAGAIPPLVAMLKIQSRSCQVHEKNLLKSDFAGADDEQPELSVRIACSNTCGALITTSVLITATVALMLV
jgi:hypothetical protein